MPLGPGSRFGSYEIVDVIGEGGMGRVYRARDVKLQRTVALKIVQPDSGVPGRIPALVGPGTPTALKS